MFSYLLTLIVGLAFCNAQYSSKFADPNGLPIPEFPSISLPILANPMTTISGGDGILDIDKLKILPTQAT